MKSGIYIIRNTINDKIYIGSTVDFKGRWKTHRCKLKVNQHHSIILQNAYNKYGKDNFIFEIVEYVEDKNKIIEREQRWLDFFNPEYNICKSASNSRLGLKTSEETKLKMSLAAKGKPKSKEHIMNMCIAQKGLQAGSKNPMFGKSAMKGKTHSDETKSKMCSSNKRATQISIIQYDINGNIISEYDSITIAAKSLNVFPGNLGRSIKQNKSFKGFIFKYKNK